MGDESKKKAERIHRRKLWNGLETAAEVHWKGRGRRCTKCGGPPVIEVIVFCPAEDFEKNHPSLAVKAAMRHGGKIPYVLLQHTAGGEPKRFIAVMHAFGCRACRAELEHIAAKKPSSYYADIKRGPGPDNPVVQVPRALS